VNQTKFKQHKSTINMDTQFYMELEAPLGENAFKTDLPITAVHNFEPSSQDASSGHRNDVELKSYVPSSSLLPTPSLLSASLYTAAPDLGPTTETGGGLPPAASRNNTYQQLKLKYMRSLNMQVPMGRGPISSTQLSQSMPIPTRAPVPIPKKTDKTRESESAEEDTKFIPPHELVNHGDTFSVWHYEQRKRVAAKEAV